MLNISKLQPLLVAMGSGWQMRGFPNHWLL